MTTPSAEARALELAALAETAGGCTECRLAEERTNVVFGSGAADADVMFVGEGPGQREDEQGLPFVGPSGELLGKLLAEIGLVRDDVYIANVVKCRPPRNRDPRPDEIDACKGYLRAQLKLVDPTVVVTLGNFASKLLLRTDTGITRLRGTAYPWWGRHLVPTFHPAAALRGSARVLEEMREDFATVHRLITDPPPEVALSPGANAQAAVSEMPGEPVLPAEPDQLDLFG